MLARSATIIKWVLYALAGLACAVVQAAVLQRFTLWGVIPFLYPLIAALPATFEGPAAGTVYALAAGVLCDLLLHDSARAISAIPWKSAASAGWRTVAQNCL